MSIHRIEALRQIIDRPTTCDGERRAAQHALDSLLAKQTRAESSESERPRFGGFGDFTDEQRAYRDLINDLFARVSYNPPWASGPGFARGSTWSATAEPQPPKPSPKQNVDELPRAVRDKPNTYRVEVESEERMVKLFRSHEPNLQVNVYGEKWTVSEVNGYCVDRERGKQRYFIIVHTNNMQREST